MLWNAGFEGIVRHLPTGRPKDKELTQLTWDLKYNQKIHESTMKVYHDSYDSERGNRISC